MTTPSDSLSDAGAPAPSPLGAFSQCHTGLLAQLDSLSRLPALAAAAERARQTAVALTEVFQEAITTHHAEEEQELFPAVLASAADAAERQRVQGMVDQLTREHRQVEAAWKSLAPAVRRIAKGHHGELDGAQVAALVELYHAHASYEEQQFLPLSQEILGRDGNHMAALGMSLHMRHAMPEVLMRYGHL